MSKQKPILVLGAGSWGTALSMVLARNGYPVLLWDSFEDHLQRLIEQGRNEQYLPGYPFPDGLTASADLGDMLVRAGDLVIAVPCGGIRKVMQKVAGICTKKFQVCIASKGLESETHNLNHIIVGQCLNDAEIAVLSGPSFAVEVAAGIPTAVTIAAENTAVANYFSRRFHNEVFRTYTHDDIVGVQVGGAIKNVMAIAAGIADGLGFGANTRAALITRGLAEITRLGTAMGGRQETFMGLAGLGDLVLTCTDDKSRNRRLGLLLARGKSVAAATREIGQVVEGVHTAKEVMELAERYQIEMPISHQVFQVLVAELAPEDAVRSLLSRGPRAEMN